MHREKHPHGTLHPKQKEMSEIKLDSIDDLSETGENLRTDRLLTIQQMPRHGMRLRIIVHYDGESTLRQKRIKS
jgi:hypothetical protein